MVAFAQILNWVQVLMNFSFVVNEKLGEVPWDLKNFRGVFSGSQFFCVTSEIFKKRVSMRAIHFCLGHQVKVDSILLANNLLYSFIGAWLLVNELTTWEGYNCKALFFVLFVHLNHLLIVLFSIMSHSCNIYDKTGPLTLHDIFKCHAVHLDIINKDAINVQFLVTRIVEFFFLME